jgi:hypothetical protein
VKLSSFTNNTAAVCVVVFGVVVDILMHVGSFGVHADESVISETNPAGLPSNSVRCFSIVKAIQLVVFGFNSSDFHGKCLVTSFVQRLTNTALSCCLLSAGTFNKDDLTGIVSSNWCTIPCLFDVKARFPACSGELHIAIHSTLCVADTQWPGLRLGHRRPATLPFSSFAFCIALDILSFLDFFINSLSGSTFRADVRDWLALNRLHVLLSAISDTKVLSAAANLAFSDAGLRE